MKKGVFRILVALLFLFSLWLLFANLRDHALWDDEASTAVLSRNVLKFGYPRSFDGLNYHYPISPELNWPRTYIWIGDPWIQNYIMALSFSIFGINTCTARLLFVLMGFLTLILVYLFCVRYLKSREIGFISAVLLATSVPFLLHMRQARYYALVTLLCFTIFYLYHRILREKKGYLWLCLLLVLVSLTHYATFVPMLGGVLFAALFMDRKEIKWPHFLSACILSIFTLASWLLFSMPAFLSDFSVYPANSSLVEIKKNFEFQVRTINGYFIPIAFWIIAVIILRFFKKHTIVKPTEEEKRIFTRLIFILLCNIAVFSIVGLRTMRYYIHYLPFLCLLEAFVLYRLFCWRKALATVIILLIIFTNFLSRPNPLFLTKGLPAPFDFSRYSKFRTYFLDYIYELMHEYIGPTEALCKYLDLHAKPGDSIKILKGDLAVMFYHPELLILNDERYFRKTYPEWIVVRKYWNPILQQWWKGRHKIHIEDGYMDVLDRYEKILLPAVDSVRENVPDELENHFFRNPKITPENQMVVYRLKEK